MSVNKPRPRYGIHLLHFVVGDQVEHKNPNGFFIGVGEVIEVRPHSTLGSLVVVKWPKLIQPQGHDPKVLARV